LLNIITNRPKLGEFSGRVFCEADYRDTLAGTNTGYVLKGTINVPIGDNAAFRVNAFYNNQDPITRAIAVKPGSKYDDYQRRPGFRAKLLIEPNDRLSIYIQGDYFQERGVGGTF